MDKLIGKLLGTIIGGILIVIGALLIASLVFACYALFAYGLVWAAHALGAPIEITWKSVLAVAIILNVIQWLLKSIGGNKKNGS